MISKELLSEVLGHDEVCDTVEHTSSYANMELGVRYTKQTKEYKLVDAINIHELAHKCKEWADRQYWLITSTVRLNGEATASAHTKTHGHYERFSAHSEPEVIFKACQWILDNKE